MIFIANAIYGTSGLEPPQMPSLEEASPRSMRWRSNPNAEPDFRMFYPSTAQRTAGSRGGGMAGRGSPDGPPLELPDLVEAEADAATRAEAVAL